MNALQRMLGEFDAQVAAPLARGRLRAAQSLRDHALPSRREENWRYTDLRVLDKVSRFAPLASTTAMAAGFAVDLPVALPVALPGFARLVFIDGRLDPRHSLPDTALLASLRDEQAVDAAADAGARTGTSAFESAFETSGDGRLGLIAGMFAPEPLTLRINGSLALEIISIATSPAYTDIELRLTPHAQLELVERHLGSAQPVCARLRLYLGSDAQLTHTRLQQTAADSLYYDTVSAQLGERAHYRLRHVAAGGAHARSTTQVRLLGPDASLQIRALATAHQDQHADVSFTVLHEAPGTHSDQLFRGIASDRGHIACTADVQVASGAPGSRVKQSLRGLLDGKGAEVDLRPRLTIDTDDIQASHGATTGRLDEDLLFYLLSRGLAPDEARSLLKWAFLGEAFSAIESPALRHAAERAAAARLSDAPAAELLQ